MRAPTFVSSCRLPLLALLGLLALASATATAAYAPLPLPAAPGVSSSYRDLQALKHNFDRRTMVDAYRKVGAHSAVWDDAALAYLRGIVSRYADEATAPGYGELAKQGAELLASGCSDPLVAYAHGRVLLGTGKLADAAPLLRRATDTMVQQGYPASRAYFACQRYLVVLQQQGPAADLPEYNELAAGLLYKTLVRDNYTPGEQRVLWMHLRQSLDRLSLPAYTALVGRFDEVPNAPNAWLRQMVTASLHLRLAAQVQQGDDTLRLGEADYRTLASEMRAAKAALHAAYALNPAAPEAAAALVACTRLGFPDAEVPARQWFDRAVAAQFDQPEAYDQYLLCLLPANGGSAEAVRQFGLECARTGRYDTAVPGIYLNALQALAREAHGGYGAWRRQPDTFLAGSQLLRNLANSPDREPDRPWYLSQLAALAWRCGKFTEARSALDEAGMTFMPAAFASYQASPRTARAEIAARTSASADVLGRAESLAEDGRLEAAAPLYQQVAAQGSGLGGEVAAYARSRLTALTWQQQAAKGTWLELALAPTLDGWSDLGGAWTPAADGHSITVRGQGEVALRADAIFGNRVEFEAQVGAAPDAASPLSTGVLVGYTESDGPVSWFAVVTCARPFPHVELRNATQILASAPATLRPQNTLRVLLWDRRLTVWLNDQPVLAGQEVLNDPQAALKQVGLFAEIPGDQAAAQFSQVRLRLPATPPDVSQVALRRELENVQTALREAQYDDAGHTLTRLLAPPAPGAPTTPPTAPPPPFVAPPAAVFAQRTLAMLRTLPRGQQADQAALLPAGLADARVEGAGTWTLSAATTPAAALPATKAKATPPPAKPVPGSQPAGLTCTAAPGLNLLLLPVSGSAADFRVTIAGDAAASPAAHVALVIGWRDHERPVTIALPADRASLALGRWFQADRTLELPGPLPPGPVTLGVKLAGDDVIVSLNGKAVLERRYERLIYGHIGLAVVADQPGAVIHFTDLHLLLPAAAAK